MKISHVTYSHELATKKTYNNTNQERKNVSTINKQKYQQISKHSCTNRNRTAGAELRSDRKDLLFVSNFCTIRDACNPLKGGGGGGEGGGMGREHAPF